MQAKQIKISGDTPGLAWTIPYFSFTGNGENASSIYMQGALHADELPGTATLHFLCELLRKAETDGLIAGNITIVPQVNPIGTAQNLFAQGQGRFDIANRTNFNRDFPLIDLSDSDQLLESIETKFSVAQLKATLLHTAIQNDIVIDLHCDDESILYAYICNQFWPEAQDFATALKLQSVFLSDGQSTAFEEAVAFAWQNDNRNSRHFVTTLELRGQADVDEKTACNDAAGLFEFMKMRGIIKGKPSPQPDWQGIATPLDNIEIVRTPVSGVVLYHKNCGDAVKAGDVLATILSRPGEYGGATEITAPQDGLIISRIIPRFAPRNQKLFKITCKNPSNTKRPLGALES